MKYYCFIFLCLYCSCSFAQKLSTEETKLYNLIMEYRKQHGLPTVSISPSLTLVAQTHVKDLQTYRPDTIANCNPHSWSSNGRWTPCCYTPDHTQAACMWAKPGELTSYSDIGFELIVTWYDSQGRSLPVSAIDALLSWKVSPGHNAVLLNKGIWKTKKWKAVGICIGTGYAVAWFGESVDK